MVTAAALCSGAADSLRAGRRREEHGEVRDDEGHHCMGPLARRPEPRIPQSIEGGPWVVALHDIPTEK
jgi:hypothetical protein